MKTTLRSAFALTAALCACQAQRIIRVTSEPSQSEVRIDGQHVGSTPCEVPFEHYGTRRITVYREGYRTYSRVVDFDAPWYGTFPFDMLTEVLVPLGWRDVHPVHAPMIKGLSLLLEPDLSAVLERAERLRRAGPEGPAPANAQGPKP